MKKSKRTTALRKLENSYHGSKNANVYTIVKYFLVKGFCPLGEKNRIRTTYVYGSGKWRRSLDYRNAICDILDSIHLEYEVKNDAPRGGKAGNYLQLNTYK